MHNWRIGCLAAVWLSSSACDSKLGDKSPGEACTRTAQCAEELRCREGTCQPMDEPEPDAGTDAEADDALEP